jgi:hypothetical protein
MCDFAADAEAARQLSWGACLMLHDNPAKLMWLD